ncbi:hypothetical protein EW026_g5018 [Hermanssonia centrifuga]|uniref:Uncharacterized protein n=1 Tax=Hermanssonia centrifuga TaxID=98765 RepID=A0A4S4KFG7_9APHY|nr:hypothetical protein EW026_g5018 [Hermanssonia centrifuga]
MSETSANAEIIAELRAIQLQTFVLYCMNALVAYEYIITVNQ